MDGETIFFSAPNVYNPGIDIPLYYILFTMTYIPPLFILWNSAQMGMSAILIIGFAIIKATIALFCLIVSRTPTVKNAARYGNLRLLSLLVGIIQVSLIGCTVYILLFRDEPFRIFTNDSCTIMWTLVGIYVTDMALFMWTVFPAADFMCKCVTSFPVNSRHMSVDQPLLGGQQLAVTPTDVKYTSVSHQFSNIVVAVDFFFCLFLLGYFIDDMFYEEGSMMGKVQIMMVISGILGFLICIMAAAVVTFSFSLVPTLEKAYSAEIKAEIAVKIATGISFIFIIAAYMFYLMHRTGLMWEVHDFLVCVMTISSLVLGLLYWGVVMIMAEMKKCKQNHMLFGLLTVYDDHL